MRRLIAARPRARATHPRRRRRAHSHNRVSAGERYTRIYEINMCRCIFCGYCELLPFDAITLGNEYEISEHNRDDQIYKGHAPRPAGEGIPVADRDLFDTPIPFYKTDS